MVIIMMGVSGSGKTTVGKLLASALHLPFLDADDLHPAENVEKMRRGIPLKDHDRESWLRTVAGKIVEFEKSGGGVIACSALKKKYRRILSSGSRADVRFVYLKGDRDTIYRRMQQRSTHFMQPDMLDSQFEALEEPEGALTVSIKGSPEEICKKIAFNLIPESP
jgi:carbohydrate kinase (thermoresistant glucokinase family)